MSRPRPSWCSPRATSRAAAPTGTRDRKSTRLNSSHLVISYAVFCLKKKNSHSAATTSCFVAARDVDAAYNGHVVLPHHRRQHVVYRLDTSLRHLAVLLYLDPRSAIA